MYWFASHNWLAFYDFPKELEKKYCTLIQLSICVSAFLTFLNILWLLQNLYMLFEIQYNTFLVENCIYVSFSTIYLLEHKKVQYNTCLLSSTIWNAFLWYITFNIMKFICDFDISCNMLFIKKSVHNIYYSFTGRNNFEYISLLTIIGGRVFWWCYIKKWNW